MNVEHRGSTVTLHLDGNEVAQAVDAYLVARGVLVGGARTVRIDEPTAGMSTGPARVIVGPDGYFIIDGVPVAPGRALAAAVGAAPGVCNCAVIFEVMGRVDHDTSSGHHVDCVAQNAIMMERALDGYRARRTIAEVEEQARTRTRTTIPNPVIPDAVADDPPRRR